MRVYGYARVSRNEDNKNESIDNQKALIRSFAEDNNYNLIDIFEDDNVTGYKFERDGLGALKKIIEDGEVDLLLVKDLSRIGRHNAQTLLFLEYLEEFNVRIISINTNYDSKDSDDGIIGIETWYNERYVKDISKKIRSSMKQKQKEGLVIIPPFGFIKNSDKQIIIDEESVDSIKLIFDLCLEGYGTKNIAKILNEKKIKTPMTRKKEIYDGFGNGKYPTSHLWYGTAVHRILKDESYIGRLRCGKTGLEKIKGKKKIMPKDTHIIHENFFPQIISNEQFDKVQRVLQMRSTNNVRAKNKKIHVFGGLLHCEDCGNNFVGKRRVLKSGIEQVEYVCGTYHKFGTNYCTPHRVYEQDLINIVFAELKNQIELAKLNLEKLDKEINTQQKNKKTYLRSIERTKKDIMKKKDEIKNYSRQLAKGLIDEDIYNELTNESKELLLSYQNRLNDLEKAATTDIKYRDEVIKSIDIIKTQIEEKDITNTQMSVLVDKIYFKYDGDALLTNVKLNIPLIYNEDTLSCDSVTLLLGNIIKLASLLQRA